MTITATRSRRLLAGAGAFALLLTGCVPLDSPAEPEQTATAQEGRGFAGDPAYSRFYEQELQWEECERSALCAAVEVPLDYADPEGETLEIQIISSDTGGPDAPHLLINPGGPGVSGYDSVAEDLRYFFTPELLENHDVVGFDPRGVHRSAPVECLTDEEMDENRERVAEADDEFDDEAAVEEAREDAQWLGEQCLENTGDVLEHVDTVSAARDMDVIRAALGEEQLHYLGFSYGTHLGIAYAEEHPASVGRFVLDGMMDTSLSDHELSMDQAVGFEAALQGYAEWCAAQDSCPVDGEPEDVVDAVAGLFEEVSEEPREGPDGRTISVSVLVSGFIQPLYFSGGWPMLNEALGAAILEDDLSSFQDWADLAAGREPDGSYGWKSQLAFRAIMCLDHPVSEDLESIEAEYDETVEAAPTFGPYLGHSGIACSEWPFEAVGEPGEPQLDDVEEILFIGTTGDPATPVHWAEDMHQMVESSSLLVYDGEGHLAYRPGNTCVTDIVDSYLLTGELFEGRQEC
ncbi:alpha/beta hydrolase [Nesterenkonia sp. HG001]|uniref:alpha/beta hydrolase n=1 Tax=Nesterenkonia sp. HG001 TaxID=2983207 RepID=UPI002AC736B1|nr:alpha/beta hydrolase [Nesterenkonia sp. HG001]MDZ5076813.1 alpha/beta hydrolase [Nesterenkonia sp. HG001]